MCVFCVYACVCVSGSCVWYVPEKTPASCGAAPQTSAHIYFLRKISNTERERALSSQLPTNIEQLEIVGWGGGRGVGGEYWAVGG